MIKLEHTETFNWEHAIRGLRNPMNSWDKSDSLWGEVVFHIGKNDLDLIRDAPTSDVTEVVRYKDCKYLDGKAPLGDYFRCNHPAQCYDTECDDQWVSVEYDDFCSCGERKEADDHGKKEQTSEDI